MSRRFLLSSALFLATPLSCLPQSSAHAPLTRTEILGRLAIGYSPSYLAHLLRTRGIAFAADAHFLDQISLAGGNGVLFQRLSSADPIVAPPSSPDPTASVDRLAICAEWLKLGYPERAESECRAAIDENPSSPWPLLATLHSLRGRVDDDRFAEAFALASRAASLGPNLPEAHNVMSIYSARTPEGAAESMRELQRVGSLRDDSDPLLSLPLGYGGIPGGFSQNDYLHAADTEAHLQQRIALDPDLASSHSTAAAFYSSTSRPERAIAELRKALDLEPDTAEFHRNLGGILGTQGDSASEISELRAATLCTPYDVELRIYFAGRLNSLGRTADALAEFQDLINSKPADWDANSQVTDFLVQNHMLLAAITDVRLFLQATADGKVEGNIPDTPENIRFEREDYLARLLFADGDLDASIVEFLNLIHAYPENANLPMELGRVYVAQKNEPAALAQLKRALQLQPDDPEAQNEYAWFLLTASHQALRNPQLALQHAQRAASTIETAENEHANELPGESGHFPAPLFAATLDTLAEALLQTGHPAEALAQEERAAQLAPDNPEIKSRLQRFRDAATKSSAFAQR